jgi:hypothetical protein
MAWSFFGIVKHFCHFENHPHARHQEFHEEGPETGFYHAELRACGSPMDWKRVSREGPPFAI